MILDDINKLTSEIMNKAFTYEEKIAAVSKDVRQQEIDACLRWQKNKNQEDFEFLWKSLKPILNKEIRKYESSQFIPQSAFKGEAAVGFVKALETYKPEFGTSLATHLTNNLRHLYRFNLAYQNVARIQSEGRAGKITMFGNRKTFLEDKLGRPPTAIEVADDVGWAVKDVEKMERDLRQDWMVGTRHYVSDDSAATTKFMDKLNTIYMFDTTPKEKLVMEYLYGLGGKQKIKTNIEIARKVGITPNRVSQVKEKIARKLVGKDGIS